MQSDRSDIQLSCNMPKEASRLANSVTNVSPVGERLWGTSISKLALSCFNNRSLSGQPPMRRALLLKRRPCRGSVIAPEVPTLTSQPEDIPLMPRLEVQHAAIHSPRHDLPQLIRKEINARHCPACRYKCVSNRYLARHAQQQHPTFKQTDSLVRQWAQSRGGVGQPCRWHLFQLGLAMVEDAERARARQELTQFEGHFRDTPVPPPARENPPHSSQAAESREASTASTAKEPTAMDDWTQSKRGTRQTETAEAEEEAGLPPSGPVQAGRERATASRTATRRRTSTTSRRTTLRRPDHPGSAFPAARGTRTQGLLPGRKGTRTTGGKDGAAGAAEIEWTTRS